MSRMNRFQWLQRQSRCHIANRHDRRLRLEPLEDRRLLTITVDTLVDENDGVGVGNGTSLREAIAAAAVDETIDFSVTGTINLDMALGQLSINQNLSIDGPGADQLMINAGDNSRVLHVTAGTVDLSGFTLTGGSVSTGGGIRSEAAADLTLTAMTIEGNTGTFEAGGIFSNGALTIIDSTISNNHSDNNGGGLWISGDMATLTTTIIGSTFSGNSSDNSGGGIFNLAGLTSIDHTTITDNEATGGFGDGVFSDASASTEVYSSIIADNVGGADVETFGASSFVSQNYNLVGGGNANASFSLSDDIINLPDAMLGSLANNGGPTETHALVAGSPAINAGDPSFSTPPDFDQRGIGFPRIQFGRVDVGAYEFDDATIPGGGLVVDTLDDIFDGDYTPGNLALRESLELANTNPGHNTVTFDIGLTAGTINLDAVNGQLEINDDVTVTGLGSSQLTVDAGGNSRVLHITNGTVDISGLTLTGGSVDRGGGIRNYAPATTTLTGMVITGNTATINSFDAGGGILNEGNLTILDSTISNNTALNRDGGGIFNDDGILTITNSTISGNSAGGSGGGVRNFGISGSTTITHSTITSNTAGVQGGGIFLGSGTVTVGHSVISGNTATNAGNEISNAGATVILNDYNLLGDNTQIDSDAFDNVTPSGTDITATSDGTNPTALTDILDATLADNGGPTLTHTLVAGSPAIDAGNPAVASPPANDQRGAPFVRENGTIDIGAYEVQSLSLVVDTLTDESDGDYSTDDFSLREALELANANPGTDTVTFDGALSGTINLNIALGQLEISDDVIVTGLGAGTLTVDAGGSSRVLHITSGTVDISGLTFASGSADRGGGIRIEAAATTTLTGMVISGNSASSSLDAGGGIWTEGDLSIDQSEISGNMALGDTPPFGVGSHGGGILVNDGITNVTHSTISDNSSHSGGGITIGANGETHLTESALSGNMANAFGGGVLNLGEVTVRSSTVSGNTSTGQGGGIHNSAQALLGITDSTVSENSASYGGGGIFNSKYGLVGIVGSTLSGNTAGSYGGALADANPTGFVIAHSTITGNTADVQGGGIWRYYSLIGDSIYGSIVAGNSAPAGAEFYGSEDLGPIAFDAYNLLGDNSKTNAQAFVGVTPSGTDITATSDGTIPTALDAILDTTLADNGGPTLTHDLATNSPAINAGDPTFSSPPDFDQRGVGFARVFGAQIDIGAIERDVVSADFDADGVVSGFDFLKWQLGFGTTGTAVHGDGDANIDSDVDNADLDIWQLQYGTAAPLVAAASDQQSAPVAASGPELIDAAMAWDMTSDAPEQEPALEPEASFAEQPATATDEVSLPAVVSQQSENSSSSNSSSEEQEDEDSWLNDELLESVFG